jgi:hypothetical protein
MPRMHVVAHSLFKLFQVTENCKIHDNSAVLAAQVAPAVCPPPALHLALHLAHIELEEQCCHGEVCILSTLTFVAGFEL